MTETKKFQVDLGGVIALLSANLYSSPGVYIRELLQNAVDAQAALQASDCDAIPCAADDETARQIIVSPFGVDSGWSARDEFAMCDFGIGITLDQVEECLATVGASSKGSQILARRKDFIGQFGIGLLSCFLVADEITVLSRAAGSGQTVRWVGCSDGSYTACLSGEAMPMEDSGTVVRLYPRPDAVGWVRPEQVRLLVRKYGEFLHAKIIVDDQRDSLQLSHNFPFDNFVAHRSDVLMARKNSLYAGVGVGQQFDVIEFNCAVTETAGVIYISSTDRGSRSPRHNRIYINRMLVTDTDNTLLPEWAFFAWVVVNSRGLHLTASRETIVSDSELSLTRQAAGAAIQQWLLELAETAPDRFADFVGHHEVGLKDTVTSTPELASVLVPHLSMQTTEGVMTIADIVARSRHVSYTGSGEDFRRIAAFAPKGQLIVNASYLRDVEIIRMLEDIYPGVTVTWVYPATDLNKLAPVKEDGELNDLTTRARLALTTEHIGLAIRAFPDADLPAVYVTRSLRDEYTARQWSDATLALNWRNRVIRALATISDEVVFARALQLLLVQARMTGHYDDMTDRATLSAVLDDLILLAVGVTGGSETEVAA